MDKNKKLLNFIHSNPLKHTIKIQKISMTNNNIVPILILTVLALSLQVHGLSLSGQKQYNPDAYAASLIETQNRFDEKVAQVKSEIAAVKAILANTTITNTVKVVKVSQGMADERNTLYDMQQIANLPFQLRECKCANLDQPNRDRLNQKLTSIGTSIAGMRASLKECDEVRCPRYEELALEMSQAQNYLDIMNETLNAECCKPNYKFVPEKPTGLVNLQNTIYKDNLNAKNWYYGATDAKEYTLRRFQLATKFNLTSCPLASPYADYIQNTCMKCDDDGQYFNLGDRKCYKCGQADHFFNLTSGQCQACPPAHHFNSTTKLCQTCPIPQVFNLQTRKCQPCAKNQFPDLAAGVCTRCGDQEYYNTSSRRCQGCNITGGYFLNKTTYTCQACPLAQFYQPNRQTCVSCPQPTHFNKEMGQCVACPPGSNYFKIDNSCKTCPNGSYFNPATQKCLICPAGTVYNETLKICANSTGTSGHPSCPTSKPFYNQYTKTCDVCNAGYYLDSSSNSCRPNNYISMCPPERPVYNATTLTCLACPPTSVYDPVNHVCKGINCNEDEFLDINTLKCIKISSTCSSAQYYDTNTKRCLLLSSKCNPAIQTFSEGLQKCVPFDQACGKGYYFDTNTNKCTSVTSLCKEDQYYSYTQGQCVQLSTKCSVDQYYNETQGRCVPRSSVCTPEQYYNTTLHACRDSAQLCKQDQIFQKDKLQCIKISSTCTVDESYNPATFKCESKAGKCSIDQMYIPQRHQCVDKSVFCTNTQFYSNSQHACIEGASLCHLNEYYDKPANSCKLISSLCYANGTAYDLENNRCVAKCPSGYVLNRVTNHCQRTTTITTTQCQPDETLLPEVGLCVKTFTTCRDDQYYNSDTLQCVHSTYITSPYAANLLMQGRDFSQYETYYRKQVQLTADRPDALRDCPADKPYYDTVAAECIMCSGTSSLFNLETSKCSRCGADYQYNPSQHKCLLK